MKLKGIELKGDYRVVFGDYCFNVFDDKGNSIYLEDSDGRWFKKEYDERGNIIYYEDSDKYWCKKIYDENDYIIYCENSKLGIFIDMRPKELTVKEIEKLLGYKIKIKGEQ